MNALTKHQRLIATTLACVMALATVSPAWAGHGNGRRYKGTRRVETRIVRHVWHPSVQRVVVRESNVGPVFAGLIGGLILGTAIAHASAPPPDYYYWDSYCDERFVSLDRYRHHLRYHHHPYVVRVIGARSGACEFSYRWHDGAWHRWDDDGWRDRGWDDRYDDRWGGDDRYERSWNDD